MAKYITCHRRGTASQWAEKNTIIPYEGEIVIEIDEENSLHKLKIGDGIHTYAELAYLQAGDEIVTQVLTQTRPRVITISLNVEDWTKPDQNSEYYSQTIPLEDATPQSRLDLQPDANMLAEFKQLGLVFVTENSGDQITVYSVGNMPLKSYTMQATIIETECPVEKLPVIGIPVGTPTPQSDWDQIDETKADYIKNKPTVDQTYSAKSNNAQSGKAVAEAIASLVNSAPETLDTLNELAAALGNDENFATTITTELGEISATLDNIITKQEDATTKEYIDEKLDSPRDKILLTDQTTQEIYELYIDNGELKIHNTNKPTLVLDGNDAQVNTGEEILTLSNNIATVSDETLSINEGALK